MFITLEGTRAGDVYNAGGTLGGGGGKGWW